MVVSLSRLSLAFVPGEHLSLGGEGTLSSQVISEEPSQDQTSLFSVCPGLRATRSETGKAILRGKTTPRCLKIYEKTAAAG